MAVRVLVVEDDQNYLIELKEEIVTSASDLAEFHFASSLKEAMKKIEELAPDLLILDIIFPVDDRDGRAGKLDYEAGVKLIRHVTDRELGTQVLVLSSQAKGFAVNLLVEYKAVRDYIFKDASWAEIRAKVRKHLESLEKLTEIRAHYRQSYRLVGESAPMLKVRDLIAKVARKDDTTVLVTGDSGTGKELVAHNIHALSGRRDQPFVVVNCAAIPETLLESEFFGYVPGAFTGAMKANPGKFELAHRGTLFLDEIAEVPVSTQVKLLRIIQDKTVQRLGDSQTLRIDVRIVAATNKNLEDEIKAGRFRQDLYYRLNVFPIHIPRLEERREDLAALVEFYLTKFNKEMEESKTIDAEAMQILARHPWPGNVRELRNIVERLIIVSEGPRIQAADVEALLGLTPASYAVTFPLDETDYKKAKKGVLDTFNRRFISYHLAANDFNILKTAQAIGYSRQDLHVLIKDLGIEVRRRG